VTGNYGQGSTRRSISINHSTDLIVSNQKKVKMPKISANCWAIYDVNKKTMIEGKREHFKREIASLTKIMTAWVVINLCK
jgi:D-alanyl-D-alanine carboxypeptidase